MRVGRISSNSSTVYDEWIIVKNIYSLMFKFYLGKKEGEKIVWIGHNLAFFPSTTSILKSTNIFFSLLVVDEFEKIRSTLMLHCLSTLKQFYRKSKVNSSDEWNTSHRYIITFATFSKILAIWIVSCPV